MTPTCFPYAFDVIGKLFLLHDGKKTKCPVSVPVRKRYSAVKFSRSSVMTACTSIFNLNSSGNSLKWPSFTLNNRLFLSFQHVMKLSGTCQSFKLIAIRFLIVWCAQAVVYWSQWVAQLRAIIYDQKAQGKINPICNQLRETLGILKYIYFTL